MTYNLPDITSKYDNTDNFNFYTQSRDFDNASFNTEFTANQNQSINYNNIQEQINLESLNKVEVNNQLHNLSILQHMLNIKNTFFNIIYDVQTQPFSMSIITKNNRLFYVSLTILILIFLYIFIIIFI